MNDPHSTHIIYGCFFSAVRSLVAWLSVHFFNVNFALTFSSHCTPLVCVNQNPIDRYMFSSMFNAIFTFTIDTDYYLVAVIMNLYVHYCFFSLPRSVVVIMLNCLSFGWPEISNEYIISLERTGRNTVNESRPPRRTNLVISTLDWVFAHLGTRE